jgi:hypothetical protein
VGQSAANYVDKSGPKTVMALPSGIEPLSPP